MTSPRSQNRPTTQSMLCSVMPQAVSDRFASAWTLTCVRIKYQSTLVIPRGRPSSNSIEFFCSANNDIMYLRCLRAIKTSFFVYYCFNPSAVFWLSSRCQHVFVFVHNQLPVSSRGPPLEVGRDNSLHGPEARVCSSPYPTYTYIHTYILIEQFNLSRGRLETAPYSFISQNVWYTYNIW